MNEKRGNVRYLWVLVGGYLLYIAWQQFLALYRGETDLPLVSIVSGAVFAAVGGWVIYREWQAYQYAKAHKDDPQTWGGDGAPDSAEVLDCGGIQPNAWENPPDPPDLPEDERQPVPPGGMPDNTADAAAPDKMPDAAAPEEARDAAPLGEAPDAVRPGKPSGKEALS